MLTCPYRSKVKVLEPVTTAALATVLTGLASGATGEAGKQTWNSLVSTARKLCGRDSVPTQALEERAGPPHEQADAEVLAAVLTRAADESPQFAAELNSWVGDARRITSEGDNVSNTISGDAHIEGSAVQARDIHGSINLGPSTGRDG